MQVEKGSENLPVRANHHRLAFVDALRGIAILSVIFVHTAGKFSDYPMPLWFHRAALCGQYGVQLFFVMSAFTLFYSLASRVPINADVIRDFFIRRFFRIAPMFYLAIALHAPVVYRLTVPVHGVKIFLLFLASMVTCTNGLVPRLINAWVMGSWSISVEVMFYTMVPFLFMRIRNLSHAIVSAAVTTAGSTVFYYALIQHPLYDRPSLWKEFIFWCLPVQFPVFTYGFCLFFLFKKFENSFLSRNAERLTKLKPVVRAGVILLAVYFLVLLPPFSDDPERVIYLFSLGFVCLAFGLIVYPTRIVVNPITRQIGKVSFSMYIAHFAVLDIVYPRLQSWQGVPLLAKCAALYIAVVPITFLISSLTWRFVEEPGIALGKWISVWLRDRKRATTVPVNVSTSI